MSDDVFRGMQLKITLPKNKQTKEKKQNFSLQLFSLCVSFPPLFFSLVSSKVSLVSSQQKTAPLSVALVFILSAGRTSHLSEHSLERTHHHARRHPLCCSAFLQYYKECFERKEREKRACCLWLYVAFIVLIGEKSTRRGLTNRHLICFFLSPKRIASHPIDRDGGIARSRVASWGRVRVV